jgi:hypothetical protein
MTITIENVPATLRLLKKIDPDLRKKVPDEIKAYAQPLVNEAKGLLPGSPPLSGLARGRFRYRAGTVRNGVRLQFKGTRPKNSPMNSWPVLRLRQTTAAGSVYDMAGRKSSGRTISGQIMVRELNSRHGKASRSIWPAVEKHADEIEKGIEKIFDDYAKIINRELAKWQS